MSEWPPLIGAACGGTIAYLFAESALASRVHPIHWIAALGGGVVGAALGFVIVWTTNRG